MSSSSGFACSKRAAGSGARSRGLARLARLVAGGALALLVGAPLAGPPVSAAHLSPSVPMAGAIARWQTGEHEDETAVLSRQGAEGMAALQRLTAVEVDNPLPAPEVTIDFGATATAEAVASATAVANIDATATAAAATTVALAVEATMEAEATSAASTATAIARQEAAASATAEAEQRAAERATATARARRATPAAAVMAAVPPAAGDAPGAGREALLPIALLPPLASLLGVAIWRRQREPFLLKAKPARG